MKKLSKKLKLHYISVQRQRNFKDKKKAKKRVSRKLMKKFYYKKNLSDFEKTKIERVNIIKRLYKKKNYNKPLRTVDIVEEFGIENIENKEQISSFLDVAELLVDFNNKKLQINLYDCKRIWPSAITLLCSLMKWVEFKSHTHRKPKVSSNNSKSDKVNSYLTHCGFYDYVNRPHGILISNYYNDNDIIKIKRETCTSDTQIEEKEDELIALLSKYTNYNEEQIEYFDSVILTEVFGNVREHGIAKRDQGWWLLAQYHQTHGIISLCIADNGIGIKNSLLTGPQRLEIKKSVNNAEKNDGDLIKLALNSNVSGALTASTKIQGFLADKYERGARKGNGLNKVKKACLRLQIPFSILSHKGYIFLDKKSNIIECNTRPNRVFAGTLYSFIIPINTNNGS